eukprot:CAMPEP_0114156046 /NCGR_PEP_ID=MMETSP0043_2-20121206/25822_1 /TAXON_ID=464988 /ORGANISM="Hemiselmis andersenii, Strain CCMP644" /LENGTH=187 /DNA_ID=CAMNT_0001251407 /DNA_START=149 /DNA_END=712 /DNA_ORIENTATION=-
MTTVILSIDPLRKASVHSLEHVAESMSGFHPFLVASVITIDTASWLDKTSHSPSLAITMKSLSPSCCSNTSGSWLRYCSIMTSPRALDMASIPITRWHPIKLVTVPPAACTLALSCGRFGLWSCESAMVFPPMLPTARLSPAFATKTLLLVTRHVRAVLPSSHTRGPIASLCCIIRFLTAASELSSA